MTMRTQHEDHDDILDATARGDVDEVAAILSIDNRLTRVTNADGLTPLHIAAGSGFADVVDTLLANNADAAAKTPTGETALTLAERGGHATVVALLRGTS
jgi:ankyrin repeat protein